MSKTLVLLESPGKIKKIQDYLGSDYIVKASFGHVQDLDKSTLSVEIENNFKPNYVITQDKKKVVKELQALAKDCKEVILAADGDREGDGFAAAVGAFRGDGDRCCFRLWSLDGRKNDVSGAGCG